jgi:hypothetical protein
LAAAGCGKHCQKGCDAERKPTLMERIQGGSDRPPSGSRSPKDPGVLNDPVAPPGVIPPRDYGIPPTSIPTTPGTFDPGTPLQPPIRNNFRPEPIPTPTPAPAVVPTEPLPPYQSKKELLLPEEAPPPPSRKDTASKIPSNSNYPDRTILLEPIMAASPNQTPAKVLQPPVEVPMTMPGKDVPDTVSDKPKN